MAAQSRPDAARGRRMPRQPEQLNDPAKIGATGVSTVQVLDQGGDVSLSKYMTLPVEQYFVLDPQQIRWIEGNRFALTVPRVQILDVWLDPAVEISVTTERSPARVVLKADNCSIRGSDLIERMQLDQKFCMKFTTELTWSDGAPAGTSTSAGADLARAGGVANGSITGRLALDVWCEVIPPFNLMPRDVLQGTCNIVMQGLTNSLLPLFTEKLSADYRRWATDSAYREERAMRSRPLQQV